MNTVPVPYTYKKATASGTETNCVKVRNDLGAVLDSKNEEAGDMPVSPAALRSFVKAASAGQFTATV
jgi:hypothetical protein